MSDCKSRVRTEAAESLAKMAPCVAEAHEALARAAKCDSCICVRLWAKKGLKKLANQCEGPCNICEPSVVSSGRPGRVIDEEPSLSPQPTIQPNPNPSYGDMEAPPTATRPRDRDLDAPVAAPPPPTPQPIPESGRSPFSGSTDASGDGPKLEAPVD